MKNGTHTASSVSEPHWNPALAPDTARKSLSMTLRKSRGAKQSVRRVILNRVLEHPATMNVEEYEHTVGGKIAAVDEGRER